MATPTASPPPSTKSFAAAIEAEITRVFALQQANRQRLRDTTAKERIEKLRRLRTVLHDHRQGFHEAMYADFHKSAEEVDLTEIATVSIEIRHAMKHLKQWMKPKKVRTPLVLLGTSSEIRYEPKGVALIISPWNYPIDLTLGPLVGAIAAGCPAMLKPSEYTPHTTRLLKNMLASLFDENEVALFEGDAAVSQALLQHPFDHIFFTGSPAVGKIVMRAAAEHLSSITLELGGKSPTIVDETADVDEAAAKIAYGKLANAGQTCIAPDYVYVHERLHDDFVVALGREVKALYGNQPDARATNDDLAHIVNDKHFERLQNLRADALAAGATAPLGGIGTPAARFLDPTFLTNVPLDTEIMREEIFGPLLPILSFHSLDEVLRTINSKPKPLALYLFSKSKANIERILNHTSAGGTCINDTLLHFIHPHLPFGGVNTSGIGQSHGHYSFLAFSNERAVLRQRFKNSLLRRFYPPYTDTKRKLIDWLLKYIA